MKTNNFRLLFINILLFLCLSFIAEGKTIDLNVIKLKRIKVKPFFYGKVRVITPNNEEVRIRFGLPKDFDYAQIESVARPGKFVKKRVYNSNGEIVQEGSIIAKANSTYYKREQKILLSKLESAKALMINKHKNYVRYQKLLNNKAVSQKIFENAEIVYVNSKNKYYALKNKYEASEKFIKNFNLYAPYDGFITEVYVNPKEWIEVKKTSIVKLTRMTPIFIDVKLPRVLAREIIFNEMGVEVFPQLYDNPVGIFNNRSILIPDGIRLAVDNYMINNRSEFQGKKTIKQISYAIRFNLELENSLPLSVPKSTIKKDVKGFYVWRAKGQRVMQPDKPLNQELQVEKVYIMPVDEIKIMAFDSELVKLSNPGTLHEYDVLLVDTPLDLKDGDFVSRISKRFLFHPGDIVTISIPEMARPGFYVPKTSVVAHWLNKQIIFIVENNIAKRIEVDITGEHKNLYRITAKELTEGMHVAIIPEKYLSINSGNKKDLSPELLPDTVNVKINKVITLPVDTKE
ncbi:MAG TPA: hypothetical protein QF753_21610 [Victivallales bacterium]|nr:hypothetical protein [Victivallales bacterium]